MNDQDINTPLWILESVKIDGLVVLPIVCELPNETLFRYLEIKGEFDNAITLQLINLVKQLQGDLSVNGLVRCDFEPVIDKECDVILLMFHKAYSYSTRTIVRPMNVSVNDKISHYDNVFTAKYFKEGKIIKKLDTCLSMKDGRIFFLYNNEGSVSEDDVTRIKSKIA